MPPALLLVLCSCFGGGKSHAVLRSHFALTCEFFFNIKQYYSIETLALRTGPRKMCVKRMLSVSLHPTAVAAARAGARVRPPARTLHWDGQRASQGPSRTGLWRRASSPVQSAVPSSPRYAHSDSGPRARQASPCAFHMQYSISLRRRSCEVGARKPDLEARKLGCGWGVQRVSWQWQDRCPRFHCGPRRRLPRVQRPPGTARVGPGTDTCTAPPPQLRAPPPHLRLCNRRPEAALSPSPARSLCLNWYPRSARNSQSTLPDLFFSSVGTVF